jgi:spore maturation protein CgeB
MKPIREWKEELARVVPGDAAELIEGRDGQPTLKIGKVYLHSRYNPREEATRLIDSAELDVKRPILVIGLGLGYHIAELVSRGAKSVAVLEPDAGVAKLAIEAGPVRDLDVLVGVGDVDALTATAGFQTFVSRLPQVLVHPPTAHIHPEFCVSATQAVTRTALSGRRLHVAVVGPMYGGSLPIAGYLERAFRKLGHQTLFVDHSEAWSLYGFVTKTVKTKRASGQLGNLFTNLLSEWTYARVAEFAPDICIVMAQAPVSPSFPLRLSKEGIVTAYWYVENWRHLPYWREIAPYYDFFFHIQPGEFEDKLAEAGCPAQAYVQTACDPEIHRPVKLTGEEQREFGCDISFAGAGYHNRVQVFCGLTDYRFRIWGVDWPGRVLQSLLCRPDERFTPETFAKVVAGSKINLNLHSSTTHDGVDPKCDAINPRVFEIAACGGFQLCDPCIGLDRLFDFDTELPVYRDLRELREKIDYYLARPEARAEIAARARERALRDHTYENRATEMLDCITNRYGARILRKGVRVQRTCAEVAARVGKETVLGKYLASLPTDLMFTHENINARLPRACVSLTYPEKVFVYLRELREFAETLIEMRS